MSLAAKHGVPKLGLRRTGAVLRVVGRHLWPNGETGLRCRVVVAMALLIVPVIVIILMLIGRNQAGAAQILGSLPIAIILVLFIVASTWHMRIGMQIVIEDYVHNEKVKFASVMANNFFCIAVALASIYATLKMSSGV